MKIVKTLVYYTNWKGNSRMREIQIIGIWYGRTPFHPEEQWLLDALDEDGIRKSFALADCNFQKGKSDE